jgi:hypothetical protein
MLRIKLNLVEFIAGGRNKVVKGQEGSQILALVDVHVYRKQQVNKPYTQMSYGAFYNVLRDYRHL